MEWVIDNIVKKSLSWSDACVSFTLHFELCDSKVSLQKKYDTCKQAKSETVQCYSDRFRVLTSRLSIPDNEQTIHHFLSGLTASIFGMYERAVTNQELFNSGFTSSTLSLEQVITICIKLDVNNRTINENRQNHDGVNPPAPVDKPKHIPAPGKKVCIHHPGITNHTTAECKHPKPAAAGTPSPPGGAFNPKVLSPVPVGTVCFKCDQHGHRAGDPSCPKKNAPPLTPAEWSAKRALHPPPPRPAAAPPAAKAVQVLDRTLPSSVMFPSTDPKNRQQVMLGFSNQLFPCLLDTGCNKTLMDADLVAELKVEVTSLPGDIKLACSGQTVPRTGVTSPLSMVAYFPMSTIASSSISHSFEVASLQSEKFRFILGMDLINRFFPLGIPPLFYPDSADGTSAHHLSVKAVTMGPSTAVDSLTTDISGGQQLLSEGLHSLIADDVPIRLELSTPPSLAPQYDTERARLATDPVIIAAIEANSQVTGFCTLSDSVLRLEIDPSKDDSLCTHQYPIPHVHYAATDEVMERWKREGKIEPAPVGCKYNNPITVVLKKDEFGKLTGVRPCLDPRKLNSALITGDKFQLPHIRDQLANFAGNAIFGEIDLQEAYLQFTLHPDSRPYTAFTWRGKQWMFVGCPFGLNLLPSFFQRIMSSIFSDLPFTFPYLDNLPFGSASWDDHRTHLLILLDRCTKANLKIKPTSIKFGHGSLKCLGHVLSKSGISIDPSKLDILKDWVPPTTGAGLMSFLGFVTFLRQHVRHFADLTAPLEAVKFSKVITWTPLMLEHFELTKQALSRAPFLKFPDFNVPFCVATDASNTGVGGVLYQPSPADNGEITAENIVAICSKKLSSSQMNYAAYKKEFYGIVYCLKQFHCYLWGRTDTVIYTDHKPLTYIMQGAEPCEAIRRWLDTILEYRFTVIHRPGIMNVLPDTLSRMYSGVYGTASTWGVAGNSSYTSILESLGIPSELSTDVTVHGVTTRSSTKLGIRSRPKTSLVGEESATPALTPPIPSVPSVIPPSTSPAVSEHKSADSSDSFPELEPVEESEPKPDRMLSESELAVEMEKRGKKCPSVPEQQELLMKAHISGHFGREAIYKKLYRDGYWWPHMRVDIETVIANCDACARFTVTKSGFHPSSFIVSGGPWDHVQMDHSVHLPPSPDGYTALLVLIDVFTGFIVLRPLRTTSAEEVAKNLWDVFCLLGLPKILQSDNGPEFVNTIIRTLIKLTGIDHRLISPYNPRADGKVERSIGTVMSIIKKLLHGSNEHWPVFVPSAQFFFNNKVSSLTNSTPFSLMFGRIVNEMKDYTGIGDPTPVNTADWTAHQERIISIIHPSISGTVLEKKNAMVERLDSHRRQLKQGGIPAGSTVMLIDPLRANKFEPKYVGPYTVVRRNRGGAYEIKDATNVILDRRVPADQLKLISRRSAGRDDNIYVVEKVLNHRGTPGHMEYLVKWKHFTHEHNTWEPASSFLDNTLIRDYIRASPVPISL